MNPVWLKCDKNAFMIAYQLIMVPSSSYPSVGLPPHKKVCSVLSMTIVDSGCEYAACFGELSLTGILLNLICEEFAY